MPRTTSVLFLYPAPTRHIAALQPASPATAFTPHPRLLHPSPHRSPARFFQPTMSQPPYPVSIFDARLPSTHTPSIRIRLFYPTTTTTTSTTTARPATWLPSDPNPTDQLYHFLRFGRIPLSTLLAPLTRTLNAPLPCTHGTPLAKRCPLVLFSHGLGGSLGGYAHFCIRLASLGYFVVAPEHSDGSAVVAYVGDSREKKVYVHYNPARHGPELPFRKAQLETRFADLRRVLTCMHGLNEGVEQSALVPLYDDVPCPNFQGLIHAERPVLAGHSFGACTVLSMCKELRARKMVCLDPWLLPLTDAEALDFGDCDTLFVDMADSKLKASREKRELLPRPSGDAVVDAVAVKGGRHNNSSDFPMRIPKFLAVAGGMTERGSNPEKLLDVQAQVVEQFFGDSWPAYRQRVAKGHVHDVQLAVLGRARALRKDA